MEMRESVSKRKINLQKNKDQQEDIGENHYLTGEKIFLKSHENLRTGQVIEF